MKTFKQLLIEDKADQSWDLGKKLKKYNKDIFNNSPFIESFLNGMGFSFENNDNVDGVLTELILLENTTNNEYEISMLRDIKVLISLARRT